MQAVHQAGWGGRAQLSVREAPRPTPGADCLLVRVAAVSIHAGDHHMLTGRPYLIRMAVGRRTIPGMDFAGVVEACGPKVERFAPGDDVLGSTDVACGAFAEYVSVPAKAVAKKPPSVSWDEAAALPTSGQTALQALRAGRAIEPNARVLINGASGGVGSFAVQLAKSMGAHVTATCSTANVELVRSLGADVVIDYRKQSIEEATAAAGVKYDKIIDAVGRAGWCPLLSPRGELVAVSLPAPESECIPCVACSVACDPRYCASSKKAHLFMQAVKGADIEELVGMVAEGRLRADVGRRLDGLGALPDALAGHSATLGQGHTSGKTVVTIGVPETMQRE